jgi:hypothetical protein
MAELVVVAVIWYDEGVTGYGNRCIYYASSVGINLLFTSRSGAFGATRFFRVRGIANIHLIISPFIELTRVFPNPSHNNYSSLFSFLYVF